MLSRTNDMLTRLRTTGRRCVDRQRPTRRTNKTCCANGQASGARFAASSPEMEVQYYRAVRELFGAIRPAAGSLPILNEGGIYHGCWIESTGTISAELLCRFLPTVAARTFASFAEHQRSDGLFPATRSRADGPGFSQIQIVTPLARCVWNALSARRAVARTSSRRCTPRWSATMRWLAQHRDTRGTGGVEAFCTYDTGHDLSAALLAHAPTARSGNDPARGTTRTILSCRSMAPDLTANVACQRRYLARIAGELGEDGGHGDDKGEDERAKRCSSSASMWPTASSTTAPGTAASCACSRTCCCASSPARSATTRSSPRRCGATCSTRGNSSRATRSPRSRWTTRASIASVRLQHAWAGPIEFR